MISLQCRRSPGCCDGYLARGDALRLLAHIADENLVVARHEGTDPTTLELVALRPRYRRL